jgi:hypothetical protein
MLRGSLLHLTRLHRHEAAEGRHVEGRSATSSVGVYADARLPREPAMHHLWVSGGEHGVAGSAVR